MAASNKPQVVRPADKAQAIETVVIHIEKQSRGGNFAADAQRESPVDYARPYGVVVMTGLEQDLVAIAYYVGAHGDRAEAALAIADA